MSALALYYRFKGKEVRGYDRTPSDIAPRRAFASSPACGWVKNRPGPSHEMGKGKLHYFRYVIHSTMS